MRVSTKVRYGLRAVIELARSSGDFGGRRKPPLRTDTERGGMKCIIHRGLVPLTWIAEQQNISLKYLERIFGRLKRAGLLESSRKRGGGYRLKKSPDKVTVGEIMRALGDETSLLRCVRNADVCERSKRCATRGFWKSLSDLIDMTVERTTIADFL
ncbi:MAG: Rrf2 family transcriptional regulator [Planctomycetota bacterium]|nr:Rrf2 family transcriptional regulator [Planctomycetota bacterium]